MPLPTARFPGAIASAADLLEQTNVVPSQAGNFPTLLAALASTATSFMVSSGYGQQLPADNFSVSIDDEIIFCGTRSGDTLSSCTRGTEGTAPATHAAGAAVLANVTAKAHNQNASEIVAVETFLGSQQTKSYFLGAPVAAGGAPNFRALVTGDLPTTLVGSQPAAEVYASPSAAAGAPNFRTLVTGDLPTTLVGSQAQHSVYAAPSGAAGAPVFRALVGTDLPSPLAAPGDVSGGSQFYTLSNTYTINAANQVVSWALPVVGVNRQWILSALYSTASGSGAGSDHSIVWFVNTWGAYPGSVQAPAISAAVLSTAYDNAMTSRVSCAGAVNSILNFTCTGWVTGYPGFTLNVKALLLNQLTA